MRKIAVITGSRAEYGLLKPVLKAIDIEPKLELILIASGMHLSEEFGKSIDEIKKDGFNISAQISMNPPEDTGYSMAKSIGKGVQETADTFKKFKPDILLVLGDRIEPLAGVISAGFMNIPIAHIHGGDSARGGLDENVRHAITKFAHIHFPATEKSAERIKKLGEHEWRIFITGAPCLDTILHEKLLSNNEIAKKFELNLDKPFILLVQHSVTTEPEKAETQIIETLEAIKTLEHQTIIIYPNSDAGGRKIISVIKKYEKLPFIKTYRNLPQKEYLSLLKFANVLIGNSSSGIIESSSFGLPVINIGSRQEGRERAGNVIDVGHDRNEILDALDKALHDDKFKNKIKNLKNPYGDGDTSKRIVKVLKEAKLDAKLIQKKITY